MKGIGEVEISGVVARLRVHENLWRRMGRDQAGEWVDWADQMIYNKLFLISDDQKMR
jgi:hypothetical protein